MHGIHIHIHIHSIALWMHILESFLKNVFLFSFQSGLFHHLIFLVSLAEKYILVLQNLLSWS
jgi:hypothetical protein